MTEQTNSNVSIATLQNTLEVWIRLREELHHGISEVLKLAEDVDVDIDRVRRQIILDSGILRESVWSMMTLPVNGVMLLVTDPTHYLEAAHDLLLCGENERIVGFDLDDEGTASLVLSFGRADLTVAIHYDDNPQVAFDWIDRLRLPVEFDGFEGAIRETEERIAFSLQIRDRLEAATGDGIARR